MEKYTLLIQTLVWPGITRATVIQLCLDNKITIEERNLSVTELYNADEVFTTGTMGELARVVEIDKRKIENKGDVLNHLQNCLGL